MCITAVCKLFKWKWNSQKKTPKNRALWYIVTFDKFSLFHKEESYNAAHDWNTYSCYVATSGSDTVYIESYAPCRLRNQGTLLQGVIDPLNAVWMHGQQETAAKVCVYIDQENSTNSHQILMNRIFLVVVEYCVTKTLIKNKGHAKSVKVG